LNDDGITLKRFPKRVFLFYALIKMNFERRWDYAEAFSKNWFNPSIETLALLRKPVFFVFICSHQ